MSKHYEQEFLYAEEWVKALSLTDVVEWQQALMELLAICENELDYRLRVMPPKSYSLIAELKQFINSIINTIKGE